MKEKELILDENTESIEAVPHVSYTRPIQLKSPQMYGEDVKAVQNRLNALKYNAGTADGYYGASGFAAVKDFQGVNGMAVDGSVGPATWDKLFSSTAKPKPSGGNSGYTRPIQLTSPQMYGEDVKAVQKRLNELKYNAGTADGYYGPSGKAAVQDFQGVNGLSIDGSVGPTTWNKLFSSTAKPKPSGGNSGYTRPIQLTSPQMYGEDVRAVQNRLNSLKYNAGTADGYYGQSGKAAVQDFQDVNGLSVDGSVGPTTWNKLFSSTAKPKPSTGGSLGALVDSTKSIAPITQMAMTIHRGGTLYNSDFVMNATGYYGQKERWFKNGKWDDGSTYEIFDAIEDGNGFVTDINEMINDYISGLTDILGMAKDKAKDEIWKGLKEFVEKQALKGLETLIDSKGIHIEPEDIELAERIYEESIKESNHSKTQSELDEEKERAIITIAAIIEAMKLIEIFSKIINVTKTLYPFAGFAYNTLRSIHHFNKI